MGYTHYWDSKGIDATHHSAIARTVKDIISAAEYSGSALVDNDSDTVAGIINLNGRDPDDYETFYIDLAEDRRFSFCKTARKPYDCVVVAVLIYLTETFPDSFSWSSDGDADEHADGRTILNISCDLRVRP